MNIHKRAGLVLAAAAAAVLLVAAPAEAATRIRFARGSSCGSYSGNFRTGKEFVLRLDVDQRLTIRNAGGTRTIWSVTGPFGEIEGGEVDDTMLEYYTGGEIAGDHFVYVVSTARRSTVQFCAY